MDAPPLAMLKFSCARCFASLSLSSLLVLIVLSIALSSGSAGCIRFASPVRATVYFSPDGGATEALVQEINAAQRHILVQAYSFTSAPIAHALVAAHKRGVVVKAVLDKSNETTQYTGATFLANAGIPVLVDGRHAIAHNKIMVIDSATVVTGSFNFTKAAEEKNAENLLILKENPELVRLYTQNFLEHAKHSEPYAREAKTTPPEERPRREKSAARETSASPSRSSGKAGGGAIQANAKSKVYHLPGCPGFGRLKAENLTLFASEREAQRAGYRKAENCQ